MLVRGSQGPCRGCDGMRGRAGGGTALDGPRAGPTAQGSRGPRGRPSSQLPLRGLRSDTRRQIQRRSHLGSHRTQEHLPSTRPDLGAVSLPRARQRIRDLRPAPHHQALGSPTSLTTTPLWEQPPGPSRDALSLPQGPQSPTWGAGQAARCSLSSPPPPPTKADFNNLAFRRTAH